MNDQLTILSKLRDAAPNMLAVGRLWSECRLESELLTYTRFTGLLNELEKKGQITVIAGEDVRKAKITSEGLARVAEAGI